MNGDVKGEVIEDVWGELSGDVRGVLTIYVRVNKSVAPQSVRDSE